jgi:hypothetical protein
MKAPEARYASGEELASDLSAVRQGAIPVGAVSIGARTQQTKAKTARTSLAAEPQSPATIASARTSIPKDETARSIRSGFLKRIGRFPAGRSRVAGLALVGVLLATLLLFRDDIVEGKLYLEATRAERNGELELSEQKLEELLGRNPDSEKAQQLVLDVSARLVLPSLPIELLAEHQHRFGSCTGRLTLGVEGLEYSSKSHGRWQWGFGQIRALDAGGSRRIAVQTYEGDMLGLLDRKNYNFSILGETMDPTLWKRYERLFLQRLAESP